MAKRILMTKLTSDNWYPQTSETSVTLGGGNLKGLVWRTRNRGWKLSCYITLHLSYVHCIRVTFLLTKLKLSKELSQSDVAKHHDDGGDDGRRYVPTAQMAGSMRSSSRTKCGMRGEVKRFPNE